MSIPDDRDFEDRYRACFYDFALKAGSGLIIGSMLGSMFLRSYRKWPLFIGGGIGFGMAYTNCEKNLNGYLTSKDPRECKVKKTP